jgi:hypothetical protein
MPDGSRIPDRWDGSASVRIFDVLERVLQNGFKG